MSKNEAKPYQVLSFYKYVNIPDAEAFSNQHLKYCEQIDIKTRVIIADEGINGVVSGTVEQCRQYMDDLTSLDFIGPIDFKIDGLDEAALRKTHVRYKPEIVNSGLAERKDIAPIKDTGKHIEPEEFREMLKRNDLVVIDVRSNYEHHVGRFKNAVTLDIDNFREFPEKVKELEHYKDKKVVTYCTGGIKCEKASALLKKHGFKDVGQLEGGIIKYAKETGGEDFEGKCYVFDERVVVDVNHVNPKTISKCVHCGQSSARVINCAVPECNDQVVVCEECGWKYDGTCSEECFEKSSKRPYDGSGYYPKDKMLEQR